jgi:hypothetical protein
VCFFFERYVFLFFYGGGLTQAKNRAARATEKQVPVGCVRLQPRGFRLNCPAAAAGERIPGRGWGFGAGLLSSWGFKINKTVLSTQTSVK